MNFSLLLILNFQLNSPNYGEAALESEPKPTSTSSVSGPADRVFFFLAKSECRFKAQYYLAYLCSRPWLKKLSSPLTYV